MNKIIDRTKIYLGALRNPQSSLPGNDDPEKRKRSWMDWLAPVHRWRVPGISSLLNVLIVAGFVAGNWLFSFAPPVVRYDLEATARTPANRELVLYAANSEPFARRGGCLDRAVDFEELPSHFIDALLAMEDRRFFYHIGVDPIGMLRAAVTNYRAGRIAQGGSTITQQLAKVSYLSSVKTFERKLEEAVIALWLEGSLTKRQILERYLSRAYFGRSCYGLRAAAQEYFATDVGNLTLWQSAYLVALLRSPSYFNNNPDALHHRHRLVLNAMVDDGRLEQAAIPTAKAVQINATAFDGGEGFYADWVAETVKLPADGDLSPLEVRTTLNLELQAIAEETVKTILEKRGERLNASEAALVAMRPDGRILAMVGGTNYNKIQFNRATQAQRQPGSSFKTFVYLAAMRAGAHPGMMTVDQPISVGDWRPENYSYGHRGVVPLQTAFASSINTVAVRVSEAVGRRHVIEAARDLGISSPLNPEPSIALGTSEVTLLELTAAYAAFAADAYPVKPWGVSALGSAKAGGPPKGAGRWELVSGEDMRTLLSATVNAGTGTGARLSVPAYGKTGTSQDYRDAWFIGFSGNLVVGVWVGNDDNSPMRGVTGGSLPARIWRTFMERARKSDPHFTPRLPKQIEGFNPEPQGTRIYESASLESLLAPSHGWYQADGNSGADFARRYGSVRLFGPPGGDGFLDEPFRQGRSAPASSDSWDPFKAH